MLPKKRRIERKEFPGILTKGKRYSSPHLLLYLGKIDTNKKTDDSKFSFSVSKKVANLSVRRNKLRRGGYSIIRNNIHRVLPNHFFFFVFKKGSKDISLDILEKEILELLSDSLMLK